MQIFILIATVGVSNADERIAVLISSNEEEYMQGLSGFQEFFRKQEILIKYDIYNLEGEVSKAVQVVKKVKGEGQIDMLYTLGSLATNTAIKEITNIPIIAGMILRSDMLHKTQNATGVTLEIPMEMQFQMLKLFLPEVKKVGVIYNLQENKEIIETAKTVAQQTGFTLYTQIVNTPQDLPNALDNTLKNVDILLGIPDNIVLTSQTAKQILLFSYRNRIPFIGLSSVWVKAGALYSLDRDYADLGRQCGEMALKIFKGSQTNSLSPSGPRKIIYSLNLKTAHHMRINFPETLINNAYRVF